MNNIIKSSIKYWSVFYNILGYKLYLVFICLAISTFLEGIGFILIIPIIIKVFGQNDFDLNTYIPAQIPLNNEIVNFLNSLDILKFVLLIVFIFLCKSFFYFLSIYIRVSVRAKLFTNLKIKIFNSVSNLDFQYWAGKSYGYYTNLINEQVEFSTKAFQNYVLFTGGLISSFILILFIITLSPIFGISMLVLGLIGFLFFQFLSRKTLSLSINRAKRGANLGSFLTEIFSGLGYLQSTDKINKTGNDVYNRVTRLAKINRMIGVINGLITSFREPLVIIILFGLIFSNYFISGEFDQIILGMMLIAYRATNSLIIVQNRLQSFSATVGSLNVILDEVSHFDAKSIKKNQPYKKINNWPSDNNQALYEFNNVWLSLKNNDDYLLKNINFSIFPNKHTVIIGKSGVGKSTIVNLLLGLYIPSKGTLTFEGNNLNHLDLSNYRNLIGYVSQKPFLLDSTIKSNLTFGLQEKNIEITDEQIWKVLRVVDMYDLCKNLDKGLDTEIGYDGTLFSGGEKHRLALAREILKKPKILILDEISSSLNIAIENKIIDHLNIMKKNNTSIVSISHSQNFISKADSAVLLNNSSVFAWGDRRNVINSSKNIIDDLFM